MTKRIIRIAFGLAVFLLTFSSRLSAQSICNSPCWSCFAADAFLPLPPPPDAMLVFENTVPGLGGLTLFATRTRACTAPVPTNTFCPVKGASASSGTAGGPSGGSTSPQAGSPICLGNGNTFVRQTDLTVPGLGGGLSLVRTWSSLWPPDQITNSIGAFGPNWRSTYEERVYVGSDYFMKYARADGSFWSFGRSSSGWAPVSPADAVAKLVLQGNWVNGGPWILTFQAGEQRLFSLTTGLLTQIIDRNGNATLITYDSSNRLATVTSASSQHLYFNYGSTSFPNVVTSVTSDFGLTLSYAYDGQGRLIQVTQPDSTTVSFTYNSQSQITAVTDSNGKLLESHTYDSAGRGLTSSEANGINSVTVSYPQ